MIQIFFGGATTASEILESSASASRLNWEMSVNSAPPVVDKESDCPQTSTEKSAMTFRLTTNPATAVILASEYLPWEFPLAFWLEKHGYDVSYISNIDTHADPAGLLRTKGFVSVGHDEYWTLDMHDNVLPEGGAAGFTRSQPITI